MTNPKEFPFLAIIIGAQQPTKADREKLRQLYRRELGPADDFEIEHFLAFHQYGEKPTANDVAASHCAGLATKEVAVLIPRRPDCTWMATSLRPYAREGARLRVFFRP